MEALSRWKRPTGVASFGEPHGVRPSSGAETSDPPKRRDDAKTIGTSNVAAPEDGRTPVHCPSARPHVGGRDFPCSCVRANPLGQRGGRRRPRSGFSVLLTTVNSNKRIPMKDTKSIETFSDTSTTAGRVAQFPPSRIHEAGEESIHTETGQEAASPSNAPPSLLQAMSAWAQSRS